MSLNIRTICAANKHFLSLSVVIQPGEPLSRCCSLALTLLLLHCMSHSGAPLPFDWEVNGKELEKPTEDSSTKKKHW